MSTICFFNTTKAWGGGEKWHLDVSHYLHEKGYSVLLVAHTQGVLYQKASEAKIPCLGIRATNLSFLNIFKTYRLKKWFKRKEIKVLVMNLSRDVKLAGRAARRAGIPRIIYRRGSDIPIRNTVLNRFLFKHIVHEVLANSRATRESVLQNNAELIERSNIKIIYNGLYMNDLNNIKSSITTSKDGPVKLITLGRLEAQKNQIFLIDVARELLKRKCRFELHIGGEGRLRIALEQAIRDHDLEDIIFLHGFIEEPLPFLSQGDIFVLPSLWEGFGYVLIEAASLEKPIVAFDTSSNPEIVPEGRAGFLTPVNDIKAFADAIENLIRDPELRSRFGRFGKEYAAEHFDLKKNLLEIETYLTHELG